jgi:predicted nucleic acid-binding protein
MLVVADSSPINVLVRIGHVGILPLLFQEVVIPTEVACELSRPRTPKSVKDFVAAPPAWLQVRAPISPGPSARLDPGERAAISLACELNADFFLIDERAGRRVAIEQKLTVIGTLGILERAAEQRLLDLKEALGRITATDFFVSEELIKQALERQKKFSADPPQG